MKDEAPELFGRCAHVTLADREDERGRDPRRSQMVQSQGVEGAFRSFTVAGRYRVERLLGRGGMASVYEARDESRGVAVALKQLDVTRERAKELFEREFHALTELAHPRVVQALDYGLDGGIPYYTLGRSWKPS